MAGARKRAAQVQHLREKALELAASGKYGEAIGRYEKLIDIDPEEAEWSRRAADCAWHLKDHQKRLKFSALAGKVYAETGHLLKAIAMCKIALSKAASSARFRWVRAPTSDELTQLTHTIAHRLARYLERQRLLVRYADSPQGPRDRKYCGN
jgi:tetratricopeptide (TPR) repeat protein